MCRVTMGHLGVTIGPLRVTIGYLRVTIGHNYNYTVTILNVTGDLAPVLSSVQCRGLTIEGPQRLSTANTQQLVAAMDTRVERVVLASGATLDIDTLAQYDGTGECEEVHLDLDRYGQQVKAWAKNIGWQTEVYMGNITIKRE